MASNPIKSDQITLGFDTSAAHCAAALLSGEEVLRARSENMTRGQAERLMPLIEELLASQAIGWSDLIRIGVGVGPGNFSGIRISVSAARGLALSLSVPAIGVTTFQATALTAPAGHIPAVAAPQDQIYIAPLEGDPKLIPAQDAGPITLPPEGPELATNIALIAHRAMPPFARPAPLYIRPADAAPPREAPPVIIHD
ncbi:MAG: tRNA (adenosine(37)-N6)-threonylcarbamoyltransferase complex dimerization subunit type 1 TsaB [Pseudomonadota bacterium]